MCLPLCILELVAFGVGERGQALLAFAPMCVGLGFRL